MCHAPQAFASKESDMATNNRKARMIISRVYRLCYPSQWLRVSNRRVVLFSFSGIAREGVKDKRSAAQNRWKNHLYKL